MRFHMLFLIATSVVIVCYGASLVAEDKPSDVSRWESAIAEFEAADKAAAPESGGVVFYGSSSARLWKLKDSFPHLRTVNRGFGGSDMAAAAHFYQRVVPLHRPRAVVLYEGDNDLAGGRTACQILADFDALMVKHKQALPGAKLICLSVKYSPSRAKLRLDQEAVNALLKALCARDPQLVFVDLASTLLDEQGQPQAKYFMPDMLHLNPEGYRRWNEALLPVLEQAIKTPE